MVKRSLQSASALLMALLFLSLLSMICLRVWHKTALGVDLFGARYQYIQHHYAALAALEWGIALYKKSSQAIDAYLATHRTMPCFITAWPPVEKCYQVSLALSKLVDGAIHCEAQLLQEQTVLTHLSCNLRKVQPSDSEPALFHISGWHTEIIQQS
jgi:hypothetical protein